MALALAFGKTAEEVKAEGTPDWLVRHRVFAGTRPSNTILLARMTPEALGKLVALCEHSVVTQGAIWQIDCFDHGALSLGKSSPSASFPSSRVPRNRRSIHDRSTSNLIRRGRAAKER